MTETDSHMCAGSACRICKETPELRRMRHEIFKALVEHASLTNFDAQSLAYLSMLAIKNEVTSMMQEVGDLRSEVYRLKRDSVTHSEVAPSSPRKEEE